MTSFLNVIVPAVPSFIHPIINTMCLLHTGDEREGYGIGKKKCSPLSSYREETDSEVVMYATLRVSKGDNGVERGVANQAVQEGFLEAVTIPLKCLFLSSPYI